jgi:hypothetical protein
MIACDDWKDVSTACFNLNMGKNIKETYSCLEKVYSSIKTEKCSATKYII